MSINHEKLKKLIALVEQNQLTELTVEENDLSITIKAEQSEKAANVIVQKTDSDEAIIDMHPDSVEDQADYISETEITSDANHFKIVSPMVGVFYRRPSPDSPPYVEIGDIVIAGQYIGMIEAMKVFSEVPSDVAGKIVEMPVENGKLIQQGDILAVIDISVNE